MATIEKKHSSEKIAELKEYVERSYQYFKKNNERYNEFTSFVFNSSLTTKDKQDLAALMKPNLEFNILEAYVSRLRGQFAEYEPTPKVSAADGVPVAQLTDKFLATMEVIEDHFRELFFEATNDCLSFNIYTDEIVGGFSVMKIYTDYVSEMSFEQCIKIGRVFNPTMCGFDPMARDSHKGDGKYCFEIIPFSLDDFKRNFGEDKAKDLKFTRGGAGAFNWSYCDENGKDKIVLVVSLFEKQYKKEKIVKLTNGGVILKKHYTDLVEMINQSSIMEQAPLIVDERETEICEIHHYHFFDCEVLKHEVTNFKYLPLVFFDGNSVIVSDLDNTNATQMTRPYIYNAKGAQKLSNFAGQTVAAEIENMKMTQWVVSLDSVPEKYIDGYKSPQKMQCLFYNEFLDGNTDVRLTPPREVQRTQTPPIVYETFVGTHAITQTILGSYDAHQGNIEPGALSGKAIEAGAMQSNSAAMPYLVNYIKGLNRVSQIILDLIPKYYVTPRTLPVRKPNGKRSYVFVNDPKNPDSIMLNYKPETLQVKVEAGVNSALQKRIALEQVIRLMGASELFSEFINTQGLDILLDNLDIRGIEQLKAQAAQFMQNKQQAQEEAAQQPSPEDKLIQAQIQIEDNKTQQRREQAQLEHAVDTADIAVKEQKAYDEFLIKMASIEEGLKKSELEQEKLLSENARSAVELSIEMSKQNASRET